MAEEEKDPERRQRVESMMKEMQAATSGKPIDDVQSAFANTIAVMCLSVGPAMSDELFISTQAALAEVFLAMRARVREGKPAGVVN